MLYREIIVVCSEIHANTPCGQNAEFLNVKHLALHIVTIGLQRVNQCFLHDQSASRLQSVGLTTYSPDAAVCPRRFPN